MSEREQMALKRGAPRVAIVHDWLTGMRGGERCLRTFLKLYPDADVYALIHIPGSTDPVIDKRVRGTSFLQRLPNVARYYRALLPLFPLAVRGFRFDDYDLVISTSHAAAKNVRVPKNVPHVCYCFTPMRYIWDQSTAYLGRSRWLFWPLVRWLRSWDRTRSSGVTHFVAISRLVAARIRCFYGRRSRVIYPPVNVSWVARAEQSQPGIAFLYVGALVPYKRVDLLVKAFNQLGESLWIVGQGSEEARLRKLAESNIHFFGHVTDEELASIYRRARALVFAGKEDFGMIPVEAMGAGRPVIAVSHGGASETVFGVKTWNVHREDLKRRSGVLVLAEKDRLVHNLVAGVRYFIERETEFKLESCVAQAEKFSESRFFEAWKDFTEEFGLPSSSVSSEQASADRAVGIDK